ncbi:MAG TPA: TadA family conjugal transfer-associated ATPase [Actinomycetales bacterium]|nr:TadA family conjugal transfer-associated ATPase [Actinomycetales bacterium]
MRRRAQRSASLHRSPELLDQVRNRLVGTGIGAEPTAVAAALGKVDRPLGAAGVLARVPAVGAALTGAGPLQPLLDDPAVTDVLVNGPEEVWVDRGFGLARCDPVVLDEQELRALAVRLAASSGRRLDDANPYVDARLADGVRLHAVLPPISPRGTLLSLRVPRRRNLTMDDLVACGSVPEGWLPVLEAVVRQRLSFLVSGGTGSGKTTILSSLLGMADPAERVLLVEDAAELRPSLPHVVRLEARHGNVEGAGEVTLQDLVRQALRMRPDRIVVGECRGAEVRDLLTALNTGHEGGCGTVHANAAADVPARLEALGALADMTPQAVASQASSALDVVLHLRRDGPDRRLCELGVVQRSGDGLIVTAALRVMEHATVSGVGWPVLAERLGLPAASLA